MAGRSKLEANIETELKADYHAARRKLRELSMGDSVCERQARAEQEAEVWSAYSLYLLERGQKGAVQEAAKASLVSVQHGLLAAKLAKSGVLDRITELERALGQGQVKGEGIRAEAARRRA